MQEQNVNNENPYEIPPNDMLGGSGDDSGGIIGKSPISDVLTSAGGIDPTRFWSVFIIIIALALGATVFFGVRYLIKQNDDKNTEIAQLRKELKECPQATLNGLKQQQQAIEDLKQGVINNGNEIERVKQETEEELGTWIKINKELDKELKTKP